VPSDQLRGIVIRTFAYESW